MLETIKPTKVEIVDRLYTDLTDDMRVGLLDTTPETEIEKTAVIEILGIVYSEFARDLVRRFRNNGLSPKQWYWAIKNAGEALAGNNGEEELELDFAAMIALFTTAAEHLKYPKVRLQTADGQEVCLGRAGNRSKNPGAINVTDGKPYGENKWFGRIDKNGHLSASRQCDDDVTDLLQRFSTDPAGVAADYGKLTGNCCFCRRQLTDERSTDVGYGPVCAGHFNLPWGE